jgi:transcription elongation GreA/GreB family factor
MQMVSAAEKAELEKKREELFKSQIDVQERIRRAAALGDLSENAEYHFAKEENRNIQRQLAELESKLKNVAVVSTDNLPEDHGFSRPYGETARSERRHGAARENCRRQQDMPARSSKHQH